MTASCTINGRRLLHVGLIASMLLGLPFQARAACEQDVAQAAELLVIRRQALLASPMSSQPHQWSEDSDWTAVPATTQQALAGMKEMLAAFVSTYMRCAPADVRADKIQEDLSRLGHAFTLEHRSDTPAKPPKDSHGYGLRLSFEARREPQHPAIAGIVADFQIACGSDAILMVFDSSRGSWKETLRWQAPPYSEVSGALGSFGYAIAPPDSQGAWCAVVKSIAPWCTSTWSSIVYTVLRPVAGTVTPRVVFSGRDSIWWGGEDFGELTANAGDFELRFHGHSIDIGVHNRIFIKHFSVAGDDVRRIQPVAISPRDFADEWIIEPWAEAKEWTAAAAGSAAVEALHNELHDQSVLDFESVRACSDRSAHQQVSVTDDESGSTYFLSIDGRSGFVMSGIATAPSARCRGRNLLKKFP